MIDRSVGPLAPPDIPWPKSRHRKALGVKPLGNAAGALEGAGSAQLRMDLARVRLQVGFDEIPHRYCGEVVDLGWCRPVRAAGSVAGEVMDEREPGKNAIIFVQVAQKGIAPLIPVPQRRVVRGVPVRKMICASAEKRS